MTREDHFVDKYGLFLDLRCNDDNNIHGSGRRVENASEGITIQLAKKAEAASELNCYIYIIMDAQLNSENGRFSFRDILNMLYIIKMLPKYPHAALICG